jgi:hypothetical protein
MEKETKKPRSVKVYTIKVSDFEEGLHVERTNDGFTAQELLGWLEHIQLEIMSQMAGALKPTKVTRNLIVNSEITEVK